MRTRAYGIRTTTTFLERRATSFQCLRVGCLRALPLGVKTTGAIEALNISPKGFHEGFLLRTTKGIVQINLPKDSPTRVDLKPGDRISAEVEREPLHAEPSHDVFRLVRFVGRNGQKHKPHEHEDGRFSGRVQRLNYALHGEVNGGILDTGDFLHLKPEGAREVGLEIGMKVEGRGLLKPMVGGHSVIEAEEVNGVAIQHKARKKHAAKHAGRH